MWHTFWISLYPNVPVSPATCYAVPHVPHLQQPEACKPSKSADVHWDLLLLLRRRLMLVCGRRGGCCWWWYERVDQHQLCTTKVGRQTDRVTAGDCCCCCLHNYGSPAAGAKACSSPQNHTNRLLLNHLKQTQ